MPRYEVRLSAKVPAKNDYGEDVELESGPFAHLHVVALTAEDAVKEAREFSWIDGEATEYTGPDEEWLGGEDFYADWPGVGDRAADPAGGPHDATEAPGQATDPGGGGEAPDHPGGTGSER